MGVILLMTDKTTHAVFKRPLWIGVLGETQPQREACPVIFKSKKAVVTDSKVILSRSEKTSTDSKLQTIDEWMQMVRIELSQMQLSPAEFTEMLLNSS